MNSTIFNIGLIKQQNLLSALRERRARVVLGASALGTYAKSPGAFRKSATFENCDQFRLEHTIMKSVCIRTQATQFVSSSHQEVEHFSLLPLSQSAQENMCVR